MDSNYDYYYWCNLLCAACGAPSVVCGWDLVCRLKLIWWAYPVTAAELLLLVAAPLCWSLATGPCLPGSAGGAQGRRLAAMIPLPSAEAV